MVNYHTCRHADQVAHTRRAPHRRGPAAPTPSALAVYRFEFELEFKFGCKLTFNFKLQLQLQIPWPVTDSPTISTSFAPPTETPTLSPTPSFTSVAIEERHLKRREHEHEHLPSHPHATPVSHPPTYSLAPEPAPEPGRVAPGRAFESTAAGEEKCRKSEDGSRPQAKAPRALRGNDESGDSGSEVLSSKICCVEETPKHHESTDRHSTLHPSARERTMLGQLPDECKQQIWRHFEALELCRVACVARDIARGANANAVWKKRARTLITKEQSRATAHRTPVECGLKRQNARRDLLGATSSSALSSRTLAVRMSQLTSHDEAVAGVDVDDDNDEGPVMLAEDSTYWRHLHRDIHVSLRAFDAANASFEAAKTEIQELKRERADLKELLQAAKSKNQSEKHVRRIQMSCVRWMNRSHRRQTASKSLLNAQSAALSKAEIMDELQLIESSIQVQSKMLFSLRLQYQKCLHRMTTQLARGTQMMRDLGCEV